MASRRTPSMVAIVSVAALGAPLAASSSVGAAPPRQPAGTVVQATIPEAVGGGKVVIGNLAVDEQGGNGFVTAYPCDSPRPLKSDLNALAGPPQSNRFIGLAGADGRICFVSNIATSLVFDANATIENVVTFPNRRTDTRGGARVPANGVLEVTVPEAVGGKVVVGNLASDERIGGGFVTAWPCDQPKPLAADLNFFYTGPVSNRFIGQASVDGRICLSPSTPTHLVFDASAILSDAVPFPPRRFDTRGFRRVSPSAPLDVFIPEAVGGKTVIGNLAVDRPIGTGFVTAYPCSEPRPFASDLNFLPGSATSNRFVGRADAAGHLCFFSNVETDIVFDVAGTLGGVTPFANRRTDTRLGAAPPSCGSFQLAGSAEQTAPPGIPLMAMTMRITNTGTNTCELSGFPAVTGVTESSQRVELAANHFPIPLGGFGFPLTTITPGETVVGVMSSQPCAPGTPADDAWSHYELRFGDPGPRVNVPALIRPACFFNVSRLGVLSIIPNFEPGLPGLPTG